MRHGNEYLPGMQKTPASHRSGRIALESRRLVRETALTILFTATSLWRSRLALRAARGRLSQPVEKVSA